MRLQEAGLNVLTLPKTIDNDIAGTDTSFGFATATEIATEAIDRVHSTAHSHHRIILTEVMGHRAGWLTLAAGLAGGADVILIPEIPYSVESVAADDQGPHGSAAARSAWSPWPRAPATPTTPPTTRPPELLVKAAKTPEASRAAKAHLAHVEDSPARAHVPAGPRARGRHRAGDPGDDPRLRPARRHALRRRPAAGHPSGRRGRRPGRPGRVRVHGRRPRRGHRSRCRWPRWPARSSSCPRTTTGSPPRARSAPGSATDGGQVIDAR